MARWAVCRSGSVLRERRCVPRETLHVLRLYLRESGADGPRNLWADTDNVDEVAFDPDIELSPRKPPIQERTHCPVDRLIAALHRRREYVRAEVRPVHIGPPTPQTPRTAAAERAPKPHSPAAAKTTRVVDYPDAKGERRSIISAVAEEPLELDCGAQRVPCRAEDPEGLVAAKLTLKRGSFRVVPDGRNESRARQPPRHPPLGCSACSHEHPRSGTFGRLKPSAFTTAAPGQRRVGFHPHLIGADRSLAPAPPEP